jgi:hypothetical protein
LYLSLPPLQLRRDSKDFSESSY